jgi:CRP-like cAMP-binding protein
MACHGVISAGSRRNRLLHQAGDYAAFNFQPLPLRHQGEQAHRLFYLVDGQIEVVEIRKTLSAGTVIGEIGVFARHQQRIATVVCLTDCELYELSASKAKELYYQDPSFGYAVLQTVIARLIENMEPANPMAANPPASDKVL